MSGSSSDADVLLTKIKSKRQQISGYLAKAEPRYSLLINCSIIAGAFAASLTAGPGIGGDGFISVAKNIVSFGVPIWQALCIFATILSVSVVITNGMLKSYGLASKIANAQACDAKLEGLEIMLELGQVNLEQATQQYTICLSDISHI